MATAVVNGEAVRWRLKLPDRLPHLKGKWLTLFTLMWVTALALALTNLFAASVYQMRVGAGEAYTWARLGLYVADDERIFRVSTDEARRAGIDAGDWILAVNGLRTPKDAALLSEQANAVGDFLSQRQDGDRVQLTVRAAHGPVRNLMLTSMGSHAESVYAGTGLTPRLVVSLMVFAFCLTPLILVASAILLFRRWVDPVAAFLSLAFLLVASVTGAAAVFWTRMIGVESYLSASHVMGSFGSLLLLLALYTFPQGKFEPRWTAWFAVSAPVAILTSAIFPESQPIKWAGHAWIAAALISMIVRYRRTPPSDRQQWRWALLGFTTGIVILIGWGTAYTAYLKAHLSFATDLWSWVIAPMTSVVTIMLIVGGVTLSVLRYRLYDAQAVVSRSAAYGMLTLGFVALFAGSEKLAELIGERYFEHSIGIVAGAVGAAVAATIVVPLHNRVHRWAERRFQKPLIRLREGLPDCVADLRDTASVEQIARVVMKRVEIGVRSTREAVLLATDGGLEVVGARAISRDGVREWQRGRQVQFCDHALACDRRDGTFPLRVPLRVETDDEPETVGWLLLGPRPDGSFFGKDEREAVEHVAGPVARAIQTGQLRERLEKLRQEQQSRANARICAIEEILTRLLERVSPLIGDGIEQPSA